VKLLLIALFLVALPPIHSQQLLLTPIGGCSNGIGRLRVSWNAPGAAAIRLLVGMPPEQQPLTGFEAPRGSTETGDWVREGLPVTLSSESGQILASANATLDCEGSLDWIPLKVGNRWIYRINTRQITATHFTRTIVRTVQVEAFTYYVLYSPETLLRADIDGRIYQRLAGRHLLLLDPSDAQSVQALLQIEGRSDQASTPFGLFPESLAYRTTASLRIERGTYVRGLGLLNYSAAVLAG